MPESRMPFFHLPVGFPGRVVADAYDRHGRAAPKAGVRVWPHVWRRSPKGARSLPVANRALLAICFRPEEQVCRKLGLQSGLPRHFTLDARGDASAMPAICTFKRQRRRPSTATGGCPEAEPEKYAAAGIAKSAKRRPRIKPRIACSYQQGSLDGSRPSCFMYRSSGKEGASGGSALSGNLLAAQATVCGNGLIEPAVSRARGA